MVCLETSFRLDGRFLRFFVLRSFVDEIDEDEDEHERAGEGGGEARLPRRRLPTDDERSRLPAFILSTGLMAMVDVELEVKVSVIVKRQARGERDFTAVSTTEPLPTNAWREKLGTI